MKRNHLLLDISALLLNSCCAMQFKSLYNDNCWLAVFSLCYTAEQVMT